ncbi:MAG: hypothetical protein IIA48_01155 [Bacteroidetes bacterium]|nr:hypothetical protein [Bacteroidota bacterium]
MKFLIILLCIVFLSLNLYSQSTTSNNNTTKNQTHKFDLNIGIGKVSGLRMGGRILFSKHFSFGTSIGRPVTLLIIPSSRGMNLSFGINYHLLDKKNFTLSFIGSFQNRVTDKLKLTYLSSTAGVMILNKKGGHFFMRIGPYAESFSSDFFGRNVNFGVNVDLGYNFVF